MNLRSFTTKNIHILFPLSLILAASRSFPAFSFIYYLVLPLFLMFILSSLEILSDKKYQRITIPAAVFSIWCLVTSLWSPYPETTIMRSLYFIFIFFSTISGTYLWNKKYDSLNFLLPVYIFVLITSLFSLITNIPADAWSTGNGMGFMGLTAHQNTLGSMILFTFPAVVFHLSKDVHNSRSKLFYIVLLFIGLIILILTYSRASILSLVIAFTIILLYKFRKRFLKLAVPAMLISILLYLTIPAVSNSTDKILVKDSGSIFANRTILWFPSVKASMNGGMWGIGYGVSDPEIQEGAIGIYKDGRFIRETGNSILAIIEETGIIGLAAFFYLLYALIKSALANHKKNIIILAFISAFIIHTQFEGWMTGVASFHLTIFFSLLTFSYYKNSESSVSAQCSPCLTFNERKTILLFIGYYLPGYKSGGPVRTISNMLDILKDHLQL